MRYLIAETDWTMMSLAAEIAGSGTLLSRSDCIEDLPHFLAEGAADLVVVAAEALGTRSLTLKALRRAAAGRPLALVAQAPGPAQTAAWLQAGADMVIDGTRPTREALASLAAVARRAHGLPRPEIEHGALRLDLPRRQAYLRDCPMKLSPKLYELLEYIALRPGRVATRAALLSHIYGLEDEPDARVFDVYICNLRASLSAIAEEIDIETVRGAGFRLALRARDAAIAA